VRQVVFPDFAAPQRVDWVDYGRRMRDAHGRTFADALERVVPHGTIWLVYSYGYGPLHGSCSHLVADLTADRGVPVTEVHRRPSVPENAGLLGFRPRG
jgi:hypothetical protein